MTDAIPPTLGTSTSPDRARAYAGCFEKLISDGADIDGEAFHQHVTEAGLIVEQEFGHLLPPAHDYVVVVLR
ncbi:MAG: hypothetical protein ABIR34_02045 [Marmoricola sp.]